MTPNGDTESPNSRVGEVIEASTTEFTTQCYRLFHAPPLGSLVRCGEDAPTYGIVCETTTQSLDPARHTIPRGTNETTESGVYSSNPQLERLLYTRFRSIIVGHRSGSGIRHYLPPNAPRMYAFVRECSTDELSEFSSLHDFLNILLAAPISTQDDVIASFLRQASAAHPNPDSYLISAGKSLAAALNGHIPRLNAILGRLA